jgi:serine/threonine-protein kinase
MAACPQCSGSCDASHRFCPACGFPVGELVRAGEDPLIGTTLAGGYVILELVGVGGMGRVYRAEQTALGRTVAVKIIHPNLLGDESAAARFISEARTASRLNHPNSVAVIDFGKTPSGQLYLVMEFLRGRDLARVVYEDGQLSWQRIVDILRQVLAALSEAHHLGIIHRDLKPENIVIEPMRTGGDFVKVVDFGLAKMLTREAPSITSVGIVCGTPDYMAPEQGRGDPIDSRSDLYAVGVILFQLLTGRLPFEAESPTQVVLMHLTIPPPDPRAVAPDRDIPAPLAAVLLGALAKDPKERYQTAEAFSDALTAVKTQLEEPPVRASVLPPEPTMVRCAECGTMVPRTQKFCGECGARLTWTGRFPLPGAVPKRAARVSDRSPAARTSAAPAPLPLTARDDEIAWLLDRQAETRGALVSARIIGDHGAGKTRLLEEFLLLAESDGDLVVRTGPDPWWAEAAFFAVRAAIRQLAALPPDGGEPADWLDAPPEARNGLLAMFGREDAAAACRPEERRRSGAESLRWALRRACLHAPDRRVVLAIDDLQRVDGVSRNAFADVVGEPLPLPVLVVAAHIPGFDARWPGHFPARLLGGFTPEAAAQLARGAVSAEALAAVGPRGVPPMYVDQLLLFGQEAGTSPPPRLADLVALRIARLEAGQRHVLQAVSVLGDYVSSRAVQALVEPGTQVGDAVRSLVAAGMLASVDEGVYVPHPLVREIAEVTMPAGARREMHAAASNLAQDLGLPIEARALHALQAQNAFEALLLLEQVGDMTLSRDDVAGAVLAFRRGLELARREIFRGELDDPMRAVLIFSGKLGEALARAGDLTDAEGVLREAIDLAPPSGTDRAKILFALARVARSRQRTPDAIRYLREAIDLAHRSGANELLLSLEEAGRAWAS